jgi:uncharacterized protein (TIGR02246 family)
MSSPVAAAQSLIRNLYSRYAHALDGGDAAAFVDCFAEDAGFWPNTGPFQPDKGRFAGRDAIGGFVVSTGDRRPRHLILNLLIEVDPDTATTATATALFLLMDTASGELRALGQYHDDLSDGTDGRWRLVEKRVSFLWQADAYRARADAMVTAAGTDD